MKYVFLKLMILPLIVISNTGHSQYIKGQKLDLAEQEWRTDNCSIYVKSDSLLLLSTWMKINRGLQIDISVHSEKQSSPDASDRFTAAVADCIRKNLSGSGIDERRFTVSAKGHSQPLISDSLLQGIDVPGERKKEALKNRRIEITITSTAFKPFFSYTDKEFFKGQTFDPALSGQLSRNLEYLFRKNSVRDPFAHPDDIVYTAEDRKKDTAFKVLNLLAVMLVTHPTIKISFEIHSSTEGSADKNLSLTSSQGDQIKKYLMSRGAHPAQIDYRPMGEKNPLISEKDIQKMKPDQQKKAHKENQRVIIMITEGKN